MRPTIELVILSRDEAGTGPGEKADHFGDVVRRAAATDQWLRKGVMLRLRLAGRPRRLHETRRHHVDANLSGELMSQGAGESEQTGFAGDDVGTVCRARMRAQVLRR